MTNSTPNKPQLGDLVIKSTSMETAMGIICLIDPSVTTPYFIEWTSGIMCGHTTAHPLDHVEQWRKKLHKKT